MGECWKDEGEVEKDAIRDRNSRVFYLAFTLWYVVENLSTTNFKTILGIDIKIVDEYTAYVVLGLLLLQIICFQTYEHKEILWICLITFFIVITTFLTKNNYILSLWMFIVAAKNIDIYKIIELAYKIVLYVAIITIFSYWMGIIPDKILYRNHVIRYSLGYSHPNVLGMRIFQFVVYFLVLKVNKRKDHIDFIVLLTLAMIVSYVIPNSKTPTILMCILLILFLVYLVGDKYRVSMHFFMKMFIALAGLFNICSVMLCVMNVKKYPMLQTIDEYLSVRFSECHKVYNAYGITMLGQKIYITQEERALAGLPGFFYLDNTYMILLIRYGVIIYLIFSIGYIAYMIKLFKEKRYLLLIAFFTYSVYGIMEPSMFRFNYNILLLFMNELIYVKRYWGDDRVGIINKKYRLKWMKSV